MSRIYYLAFLVGSLQVNIRRRENDEDRQPVLIPND